MYRGLKHFFLCLTHLLKNPDLERFKTTVYEIIHLYILYIITVSDTLFQLHNRRENQSEKRMENCAGIRAFSLVLISPFRLIPNHNVELIAH